MTKKRHSDNKKHLKSGNFKTTDVVIGSVRNPNIYENTLDRRWAYRILQACNNRGYVQEEFLTRGGFKEFKTPEYLNICEQANIDPASDESKRSIQLIYTSSAQNHKDGVYRPTMSNTNLLFIAPPPGTVTSDYTQRIIEDQAVDPGSNYHKNFNFTKADKVISEEKTYTFKYHNKKKVTVYQVSVYNLSPQDLLVYEDIDETGNEVIKAFDPDYNREHDIDPESLPPLQTLANLITSRKLVPLRFFEDVYRNTPVEDRHDIVGMIATTCKIRDAKNKVKPEEVHEKLAKDGFNIFDDLTGRLIDRDSAAKILSNRRTKKRTIIMYDDHGERVFDKKLTTDEAREFLNATTDQHVYNLKATGTRTVRGTGPRSRAFGKGYYLTDDKKGLSRFDNEITDRIKRTQARNKSLEWSIKTSYPMFNSRAQRVAYYQAKGYSPEETCKVMDITMHEYNELHTAIKSFREGHPVTPSETGQATMNTSLHKLPKKPMPTRTYGAYIPGNYGKGAFFKNFSNENN